jgi:FMN phosphatase YigB (HAD superfamily)
MSPPHQLEAVTFDFWNTLMWEPPDALVAGRMKVLCRILAEHRADVDEHRLRECHQVAFLRYQAAWVTNEQYCVPEAVDTILAELGVSSGGALRDDLIDGFSEAGRATSLHLAEGADTCLRQLAAAGVQLAIICDIGLTPSPVLRWHLEDRGLLDLFASQVFSDETGIYKPDPAAFHAALQPLGVAPERAAHVGDRKRTDIGGALAVGMTAIRYRGVYDDISTPEPEAHYVTDSYVGLAEWLLSGQRP